MEISKEALKLSNTSELTKEIEEILKNSQDKYNETSYIKKKEDTKQKEEEQRALEKAQKAALEKAALDEKVEVVKNEAVIIPPIVKEKQVKKPAKVKAPTPKEQTTKKQPNEQHVTELADKKSAYENMLKDVLKGLATNACFNTENDLIITFDIQSWDGLSNNEQDEIVNVLKYQVGKLKRDLKGSKVSGHVSLVGSEGQSLNTFYVQNISDGENGNTTIVY